jgi:formimidoylglutamate deiminase
VPQAWLGSGVDQSWAADVMLEVAADGTWAGIRHGVPRETAVSLGAECLAGALLPGVIDAHSHAFQRAFAGLSERREHAQDDFWSWRDRMYRVALAMSPDSLRAIAVGLYLELLRGGYTQVCEFHYLHRDPAGAFYPDELLLAWTLADAATEVGIGLTLLPVVYERSGFGVDSLRDDQRRFRADAAWALAAAERIDAAKRPLVNAGVALHSLRAASTASIRRIADSATRPIHIHVAEQTAEVEDCLRATGRRPVAWLLEHVGLDARWQLVHATHVMPAEIDGVAARGACAVLCPTTEANLGDGLTDLPRWLVSDAALAIGSDSHVTRDWREELRLLEYGQRLALRQRNVAAHPEGRRPATAERLFARIQSGAAASAGQPHWGLVPGARADAVHVNGSDPALLGVPRAHWLDALVFSSPGRPFDDVWVAGRRVLEAGRHDSEDRVHRRFAEAMATLWPPEHST